MASSLVHVGSFIAVRGLTRCGTGSLEREGSVVTAHGLLLLAVWNLSSLIRDRTHVPCMARQILNHWTTREVPASLQ